MHDLVADVLRIAAFCEGDIGGNPAGVLLASTLPDSANMQRIANEVGFSETAFAMPTADGWRVRYFAPQSEVPFCGHATIALGAALAMREGDGIFALKLNNADITVESRREGAYFSTALQSPSTYSQAIAPTALAQALALFGYSQADLNPNLPPALIHAGLSHLVLALRSRELLAAMHYDLDAGRVLMEQEGWGTIMLAYAETPQLLHTRNAFAIGGVYEDPATGAATAALAGYLRDIDWPHGGVIDVIQGEDMGMRSRLRAEISSVPGSSIRVSGMARRML